MVTRIVSMHTARSTRVPPPPDIAIKASYIGGGANPSVITGAEIEELVGQDLTASLVDGSANPSVITGALIAGLVTSNLKAGYVSFTGAAVKTGASINAEGAIFVKTYDVRVEFATEILDTGGAGRLMDIRIESAFDVGFVLGPEPIDADDQIDPGTLDPGDPGSLPTYQPNYWQPVTGNGMTYGPLAVNYANSVYYGVQAANPLVGRRIFAIRSAGALPAYNNSPLSAFGLRLGTSEPGAFDLNDAAYESLADNGGEADRGGLVITGNGYIFYRSSLAGSFRVDLGLLVPVMDSSAVNYFIVFDSETGDCWVGYANQGGAVTWVGGLDPTNEDTALCNLGVGYLYYPFANNYYKQAGFQASFDGRDSASPSPDANSMVLTGTFLRNAGGTPSAGWTTGSGGGQVLWSSDINYRP